MSKNLEDYSREELIEHIKGLKKTKKFGLVWEEKSEKVVEECNTKLPVVKEVEEKAIENALGEPTNIIIEGDNYHALSVLNYTHAGKIDVIYIDPPYNTGNKDFVYNDCYVDKEDTFRHSKWLSFMDKRLRLAKNLLADDGVIFISIDDRELFHLKMLCDEIYNDNTYLNTLVWKKNNTTVMLNQEGFSTNTEYILVYKKNNKQIRLNNDGISEKLAASYNKNDNDGKGFYRTTSLYTNTNGNKKISLRMPDGSQFEAQWQVKQETLDEYAKNGLLVKTKTGWRKKIYLSNSTGNVPVTLLDNERVGTTKDGTSELVNLGLGGLFSYPKPTNLIKYIVSKIPKENAVILDFFAGSGTTGQAVMELNKEDGGHRQFILVTNNENQIAENVTYPRIKTVITGVRSDGSKYSDGIPANLRYFKTDFVEKGKTTDDTREALITECSDMIRIRENAFEFVASTPEYRFYKNGEIFVPIIFDQFAIAETWEKIEELNIEKLPVHCYNFSYNRHANEEEIPEDTKLEWTACSIPETVLEVYKKIFKRKEN